MDDKTQQLQALLKSGLNLLQANAARDEFGRVVVLREAYHEALACFRAALELLQNA